MIDKLESAYAQPIIRPPSATFSHLAPIVLVAFKRPLTTLQTLYTLSRCPEAASSELYVFCDGARQEGEKAQVQQTRDVVRSNQWCGRVEIIESGGNSGVARSVIGAVSRLCESHGRVIVLEDDLLVARGFLAYMNESLRRYAGDDRVMTISAHTFDAYPPEPRAVFLPTTTTWGWATWSRAWRYFQEQPEQIDRLDSPSCRRGFNLDGSFDYVGMLRSQLAGKIDSWGIRWQWSVYNHRGLGLFPVMSLVRNIGVGPDSTHTRVATWSLEARSWRLDNEIRDWPDDVCIDEAAFDAWKTFLRGASRRPLRSRARRALTLAVERVRSKGY